MALLMHIKGPCSSDSCCSSLPSSSQECCGLANPRVVSKSQRTRKVRSPNLRSAVKRQLKEVLSKPPCLLEGGEWGGKELFQSSRSVQDCMMYLCSHSQLKEHRPTFIGTKLIAVILSCLTVSELIPRNSLCTVLSLWHLERFQLSIRMKADILKNIYAVFSGSFM